MNSKFILGVRVHATSYDEAAQQVIDWAKAGESRMVCAANVHMIMEAHDDAGFKAILNDADLVTPDGMPLVWMMRKMGSQNQTRVYGPDLMFHVLAAAEENGVCVGFFGAEAKVLDAMVKNLLSEFPGLQIAYFFSPPFGSLVQGESDKLVSEIRLAKPRILFVALGCPKQERWMARNRDKLQTVMLGVGAAFDFFAGAKRQAPRWMRKIGLEWLFRLLIEPKRLWRRYFFNNPRFIWYAMLQLFGKSQHQ